MSEKVIHPTDTCFDDMMEALEMRVLADPTLKDDARLLLVHAIVLQPDGPERDKPFAHAWLEEGERMWQSGILDGEKILFSCDKEPALAELRVQDATRYTIREAAAENRRTVSLGPWEERYEALCKEGK